MSTRKTTLFYALLIAVASVAVGMVIASRLDLSPTSSAQTVHGGAAGQQRAAQRACRRLHVPHHREVDEPGGGEHPHRVAPAPVADDASSSAATTTCSSGSSAAAGGRAGSSAGRSPSGPQITQAAGTGFIISKDGFILTNNHVVEDATKIQVSFYGDDADVSYLARVVGRDPLTDSALIELTEKPKRELTEVKFGDSAQMQPGDWVMAIGNPFGLAHTVSVGVISATERPFPITDGRSQDVLQTDAAINPGNSGGPLLNVRGEVVGINTAIYTDSRQQGNIGIGFAIPINTVRELLPQLRSGKVTRGVIGVSVGTIPLDALEQLGLKERAGALVSSVTSGGPAAQGRRRAGRRDRRVQRQAGEEPRRPGGLRDAHRPGHDGAR